MTFFQSSPTNLKFSRLHSIIQSIPPPISEIFSFPTLPNFSLEFVKVPCFLHAFCDFRLSPTLTMMHLCITQGTTGRPCLNVLGYLYYFNNHSHISQLKTRMKKTFFKYIKNPGGFCSLRTCIIVRCSDNNCLSLISSQTTARNNC